MTYDLIKDSLLRSTPLTGVTKPPSQTFNPLFPNVDPKLLPPPTDNLPCHFVSAFGAGLCTTIIASPVDVVKTRYMNSPPGQYGGVLNCAASMLTKEGPLSFYKGSVLTLSSPRSSLFHSNIRVLILSVFVSLSRFMPSFLRLGSWNVVMFVTYEQLKRAMTAANRKNTSAL